MNNSLKVVKFQIQSNKTRPTADHFFLVYILKEEL